MAGLAKAMAIEAVFSERFARVLDLAHRELDAGHASTAVAIAVLVRERAPSEPAVQEILSLNAGWHKHDEVVGPPAEHHLALAEAYRLLGENEEAVSLYRKALTYDGNLPLAHDGLASLRLPGDNYLIWLDRFYASCAPETVIEIGVYQGLSLARVKPPTIAIGIDPNPCLEHTLTADTHIFPETSDAFFARRGPEAVLNGRPLGMGFIDGLHLYEQALKDFINLEGYCSPRSIILLHDTIPLDEATQRRECITQFYTGDVWKTVLCLKYFRPDLDVFTIAAPWTGLTVVTGFNPASRLLSQRFDEAVAKFIEFPYAEIENSWEAELNVVPNDWSIVEARLKAQGVL